MTRVVGVDLGTTSTKAAAFDPDGEMHGHVEEGYPLDEPHPGWAVQDPELVVTAAMKVIDAAPDGAAMAFSTAMHSLVGLDAHDKPVTPIITWGDTRSVARAARLRSEHPELHARTGTPLHPMSPLVKLCWMRDEGIEAHRWVGVKELVLHRLTGDWVMDHSTASGTGMMDLSTQEWDEEALALAGVTAEQLPRLVPTTERLGDDLIVGAGDGPLANLGVGAVEPGVAACSIGTSGALRLVVDKPAANEHVFCYVLTPGRWVVGGAINNGGVVLEWLHETLGGELTDLLDAAAAVPAGSEGLVMQPYLLSERAPYWRADVEASFEHLHRGHGRGHLVRAALEGVCRQLALVQDSMRDAGLEVREVRATGGFARSVLWKQMLADHLDMPLGFTSGHEGSAFGAALLGMQVLGIDTPKVAIAETVDPDPEAAEVYRTMRVDA